MAGNIPSKYAVLRKPRITEKTAFVKAVGNTVVFEVLPTATKLDIKHSVEKIFGVKVKDVRTANYRGKLKRVLGRVGYRKARKHAYVTLAEGSSLDVIEGL